MSLLSQNSPIIAISLKLYFSPKQTLSYLENLVKLKQSNHHLIFIPDFLSIWSCSKEFPTSKFGIHYGAQDGHWEDEGAWTGEVSMRSLKEVGCSVVELGHAERKAYFGETSEVVTKKCRAAVRNGLVPLVCIGEPEEVGVDSAMEVIKTQLDDIFRAVSLNDDLLLAYEPVWAIGKPVPAPPSHIIGVGLAIRQLLKEKGRNQRVKVLYGGSAGPGLWLEIKSAVDGMFLGRFSHKIENVQMIMSEMEG